jgi:hypothetical protein
MPSKKPSLGPAINRMDDGRPERMLPDPRRLGPARLGKRLLPQVPAPTAHVRHTAGTRRGSR